MADKLRLRIQQRTDKRASWVSANPVLLNGEVAFESDTGLYKIGNGIDGFNSLSYGPAARVLETTDITSVNIADSGQICRVSTTTGEGTEAKTVITYYICTVAGTSSENKPTWEQISFASDASKDLTALKSELEAEIGSNTALIGSNTSNISANSSSIDNLTTAIYGSTSATVTDIASATSGLAGSINSAISAEANSRSSADKTITDALFGADQAVVTEVSSLSTTSVGLLKEISNAASSDVTALKTALYGSGNDSVTDITSAAGGLASSINSAISANTTSITNLQSSIYGSGSAVTDIKSATDGLAGSISSAISATDSSLTTEISDRQALQSAIYGSGSAVTDINSTDISGGLAASIQSAFSGTNSDVQAIKTALYGSGNALVTDISSTEISAGLVASIQSAINTNTSSIATNASNISANSASISSEISNRQTLQTALYGSGVDPVATVSELTGGVLNEISSNVSAEVSSRSALQTALYGASGTVVSTLDAVSVSDNNVTGLVKEIKTALDSASSDTDELNQALFGTTTTTDESGKTTTTINKNVSTASALTGGILKDLQTTVETECSSNVEALRAKIFGSDSSSTTVLTTILPSYVDDIVEGVMSFDETTKLPTSFTANSEVPEKAEGAETASSYDNNGKVGEAGKIYVDTNTNLTYRWSGTRYVEISASLAIGKTDKTAYQGSLGLALEKTVYGTSTDETTGAETVNSYTNSKSIQERLNSIEQSLADIGATSALGALAYENTVSTSFIDTSAVTTEKIASAAVTADKIAFDVIECGGASDWAETDTSTTPATGE